MNKLLKYISIILLFFSCEEKIIEKEISETDLDHIKSGPNELVIGNFWIFLPVSR
jgi:hypothetical protein